LVFVLYGQAAWYALSAVVAGVAYLVRGADGLGVGGYASFRTHPVTMLVVGLAAGLLVLAGWRLPARPEGLYRALTIVEGLLFLDGIVGVLSGIFNIWWLVSVLVTFAVLWLLRTEESRLFLQ
jgi:hypothetical protein